MPNEQQELVDVIRRTSRAHTRAMVAATLAAKIIDPSAQPLAAVATYRDVLAALPEKKRKAD